MEPKNHLPIEKENHLPNLHFLGSMLIIQGCNDKEKYHWKFEEKLYFGGGVNLRS